MTSPATDALLRTEKIARRALAVFGALTGLLVSLWTLLIRADPGMHGHPISWEKGLTRLMIDFAWTHQIVGALLIITPLALLCLRSVPVHRTIYLLSGIFVVGCLYSLLFPLAFWVIPVTELVDEIRSMTP